MQFAIPPPPTPQALASRETYCTQYGCKLDSSLSSVSSGGSDSPELPPTICFLTFEDDPPPHAPDHVDISIDSCLTRADTQRLALDSIDEQPALECASSPCSSGGLATSPTFMAHSPPDSPASLQCMPVPPPAPFRRPAFQSPCCSHKLQSASPAAAAAPPALPLRYVTAAAPSGTAPRTLCAARCLPAVAPATHTPREHGDWDAHLSSDDDDVTVEIVDGGVSGSKRRLARLRRKVASIVTAFSSPFRKLRRWKARQAVPV